jgi:hypothetical protein
MLSRKQNIIKSKRIYLKNFTRKDLIKKYFNCFRDNIHLKYSRHKQNKYTCSYFLEYYLPLKQAKNLFLAIYKNDNKIFLGTITININYAKKVQIL